jgi:hypothetical protein
VRSEFLTTQSFLCEDRAGEARLKERAVEGGKYSGKEKPPAAERKYWEKW